MPNIQHDTLKNGQLRPFSNIDIGKSGNYQLFH
jgi:hypothetical protein